MTEVRKLEHTEYYVHKNENKQIKIPMFRGKEIVTLLL